MKTLLIDNYDSFTYNLFHYLSSLKCKVEVIRNDKINSKEIVRKGYKKIVISPGPGNPNQAGNCLKIVKDLFKKTPILGVCLGHQIIAQAFGTKIVNAKKRFPFIEFIKFEDDAFFLMSREEMRDFGKNIRKK